MLKSDFERAFSTASSAREKGMDPERFVEIKPAPDLASRVEGIIGIDGLASMMKSMAHGKSRQELAFAMVKELCLGDKLKHMGIEERLLSATRVGLAIITDAVVVAPTEGLQAAELHKNADGSDYVAIVYAGPIRGAGGTGAAMSVALADYGRRQLGIGPYRAQQSEVERYIEEMQIYHSRIARLQYYPPESDMKMILSSLEVCVDGMPTEKLEVNIHRNMKRLDKSGKEQPITNRVRGGIGLVVCEGIAQKAKSVLKHTKNAGLDWSWLNNVIKADKTSTKSESKDKAAVFLQELIAGRPVLAYPERNGSFRLRYGRSRLTGIAAKGFSPATMVVLKEFIACGTQLRIEKPGKGCVAAPVDSIEGPFVKLDSGEALRISSAEEARALRGRIAKIISVGDILITFGDFRKSNTPLVPTSYVEEYWASQIKAAGFEGDAAACPSFAEAFALSGKYNVPMHPKYIYDYSDITSAELAELRESFASSSAEGSGNGLFGISAVRLAKPNGSGLPWILERLCIPHNEGPDGITITGDHAQAIAASLGFSADGGAIDMSRKQEYSMEASALDNVNSSSPFRIMRRSTRIGGRIGRPEKARERLMKPAPNVLFPIGEYGGKERNIYKAYANEKKKFGNFGIKVEVARYRCSKGREQLHASFCYRHSCPASLERTCSQCGRISNSTKCQSCGGAAYAKGEILIDIKSELEAVASRLGIAMGKSMKGVKGLTSRDKMSEPLEKGVLRADNNIHMFKDGTSRFDATDMPMTHFYPSEIGTGVERLRELGYTKDWLGNELESPDQLVEMFPQDIVLNSKGGEFFLKVARFVDQLLVKFYHVDAFYNIKDLQGLVGHSAITLSPHTSAGVLCRIIGFTEANVGFAHPYVISARRRNCDGDEDTTMLLLDALVNFSRSYLPVTIGGTMDAPLILTVRLDVSEVDDEVHEMEVVRDYGLEFYEKTMQRLPPAEAQVELVRNRMLEKREFDRLYFTHLSGATSITTAPHRSVYTTLNSMKEKIEVQFNLMDMLCSVDKADSAKRLIISHFIPDLIGNMHSFSRQSFRCVACNAKFRRVPLTGSCTSCKGKLVLTISKGSIEKYLVMATELAERYNIEPYIRQRLALIKDEIKNVFGVETEFMQTKQFNLSKFM